MQTGIFVFTIIAVHASVGRCGSLPASPTRVTRQAQGGPPSNAFIPVADDGPVECPNIQVVQNFKANEYIGRWFEIERFQAPFQTGQCGTADYSLYPNCSISVVNTQVLQDGTFDSAKGVAYSGGDPSQGSLTVTFPEDERQRNNVQSPQTEGNYNILATDYANYAVVYSCSIANFRGRETKFEFSWVLARRPQVNAVFLERLHGWLKNLGVPVEKYAMTRHQGCQYASA